MEKAFQTLIQNSKRNTRAHWFTIIIMIIILSVLVLLFITLFSIWICYFLKRNRSEKSENDFQEEINDNFSQISKEIREKGSSGKKNSDQNLNRGSNKSKKEDSVDEKKISKDTSKTENIRHFLMS